jgi:hypothetical protein
MHQKKAAVSRNITFALHLKQKQTKNFTKWQNSEKFQETTKHFATQILHKGQTS